MLSQLLTTTTTIRQLLTTTSSYLSIFVCLEFNSGVFRTMFQSTDFSNNDDYTYKCLRLVKHLYSSLKMKKCEGAHAPSGPSKMTPMILLYAGCNLRLLKMWHTNSWKCPSQEHIHQLDVLQPHNNNLGNIHRYDYSWKTCWI